MGKRPTPATCGDLGVQEWWEVLICGGAGGRVGRKVELLNWVLYCSSALWLIVKFQV